jgi:hypothetical protein
MNWLQKLQIRWKVGSIAQVIVILIVFACTGTTVVWIAKPILIWIFEPAHVPLWGKILYYILILPAYNIFLLAYGFAFGQFRFFYDFEKRFLNRIMTKFKSRKNKTTRT